MQKFIESLSAYSGKSIKPLTYFSQTKHISNALSFGLFTPLAQKLLQNVQQGIILHPFFSSYSHYPTYRYEIGTEHSVSTLLGLECMQLGAFIKKLDTGYLINESSLCEEEVAQINTLVHNSGALLLGRDLYLHPQNVFIAQMLGIVARINDLELFVQDMPQEYTSTQNLTLDSALDTLDSEILEELPENNGAFVYMCLDKEIQALHKCESRTPNVQEIAQAKELDSTLDSISCPSQVLYAPETFKAILKVWQEGDYTLNLSLNTKLDSQIPIKLRFDPRIKGTIGCIPFTQIKHYPFVQITALKA